MIGNNYKMSNVLAAILLSQIEQIDSILSEKQIIYNLYKQELENIPNIKFQKINDNTTNSYWNMILRIEGNKNYKETEEYFKKYNIETRPMFYPLQGFDYLKELKVPENSNSYQIQKEYIYLPFNNVKKHNIIYICNILKKYIKEKK